MCKIIKNKNKQNQVMKPKFVKLVPTFRKHLQSTFKEKSLVSKKGPSLDRKSVKKLVLLIKRVIKKDILF